jgi:hypothetical protein
MNEHYECYTFFILYLNEAKPIFYLYLNWKKTLLDNSINLGEIKVVPLRDVWANEARDFTPWLLDNAHLLSQAIGLELDLHEAEHSVGRFSLDLFGKVEGTEHVVIVENQLDDSDHKHFGQLMTYAGGTDAKYVIWIAPKFHKEYLSALDWLNNGTTEDINFFAVEVSAVQIGDSLPAALFKVVAQPNSWTRDVKAATSTSSNKEETNVEFWNKVITRIRLEHKDWKSSHSLVKGKWISISNGLNNSAYGMAYNNTEIKSELKFLSSDKSFNTERFQKLYADKDKIEQEYGGELIWHFPEENSQAIIRTTRKADFLNKDSWDDMVDWILAEQTKLRKVFAPYLKTMK